MRKVSVVGLWITFGVVLLISGCQSTGVNEGVYGSDNFYEVTNCRYSIKRSG